MNEDLQINKTAYDVFFENYDYYWLKFTMERGIREKADKLLVGHSLARFGVNDRDIPGLINLSFLSQDYYYSYRIIERALELIPSINHVVLGTGYVSPYMDLSRARDRDEMNRIISVYDRYFHDIHNMSLQKYRELKAKEQTPEPEEGVEEICREFFEAGKNDYFCPERDRQSLCDIIWNEPMPEEKRAMFVKERVDYINSLARHTESYDENEGILKEMVKSCKDRGIGFSVVVFPANVYYRRYLDPQIRDSYLRQIKKIPDHKYMECLDFFESEEFDSINDFADADHLNDAGAAKMTALLLRYMEGR